MTGRPFDLLRHTTVLYTFFSMCDYRGFGGLRNHLCPLYNDG